MSQTHSRSIARNAGVVAAATLLSRISGFLRDLVTAFALGAGPLADAFFVAFRIPNILRRMFGEGALTMSFIPVFSRTMAESGRDEAFAMARSAMVWLMLILGAVTCAAMIWAEPLTLLITPGFADKPELLASTARLTRICFPYINFICAVALCMGILNSLGHFLAPALCTCALNAALIASALLGWWLGLDVAACMAFGVLAGGLVQWLIQQPFLRRHGFAWRGQWSWRHPGVARMGRLMLPTVFGAAVYQINVLLSTLLASFLPTGSISWLYYADRLMEFPLGVFGLAVSTAALPSLAALAAAKKTEDFASTLRSALHLTLFIALPSAAGLIALSAPIVRLLFMRGAFDAADVASTSTALVAYCLGLPFIALARPLVSAFYAQEDTRTPVRFAAMTVVLNLGAGAFLMQHIAHVGLAAGVSLAALADFLLLSRTMRRRTGAAVLDSGRVLKILALSLGLGLGGFLLSGTRWLWAAGIPVLAAGYFLGAKLLGMEEYRLLADLVAGRLRRAKAGE